MPLLILSYLEKFGIQGELGLVLANAIAVLSLIIVAWLVLVIIRNYLSNVVHKLIKLTKTHVDDLLIKHRVFIKLAHIAPAAVIMLFSPWFLEGNPQLIEWANIMASVYLVIYVAATVLSVIDTLLDAYRMTSVSRDIPIQGVVQVVKLVIYILAGIVSISLVIDKSPAILLSGLGALTAVLILVFKDTILGLVAGIQIAANRMVRIGDWIEMPSQGADGEVLEVGLTTVKIQNWDKTIVSVPTYFLISGSFKNWRGMEESGGRRIKRSIKIDVNSIRFYQPEEVNKLREIKLISEYLDVKTADISRTSGELEREQVHEANKRRLTNIGTFRAYVEAYLKNRDDVNQEMTLIVRQLQPTETGVPLELYFFCKNKSWAIYEAIQADIFDHLFAMMKVFDLRHYQRVSDR